MAMYVVVAQMSSSSEISMTDSSSSDQDAPLPPPHDTSVPPLRGPPRQLCQCTKCVGQVSQKTYVCAQHIERFGRWRRHAAGASSSHVGCFSLITPYCLHSLI